MIKDIQLRHVGITVSNMVQSLWFYRDLLGLKVVSDCVEDRKWIHKLTEVAYELRTIKLTVDNSMVELLEYDHFDLFGNYMFCVGCSHVAFTVDNIDELYDKLITNNIKTISSPQNNGKVKVFFCLDPNNVHIEFVEELDGH